MSLSLRQHRILITSAGCVAAYGAVLLMVDHTVESEGLWRVLLEAPKSRKDLIVLSAVYAVLSVVLALLSSWQPAEAPAKWFRASLIGVTVLAALGSVSLLAVVVVNLDWKMSL
jgi:hypothetical protein